MKPQLRAGERLLEDLPAHLGGPWQQKGRLRVTNQRIIFEPERFQRNARHLDIPLEEVTEAFKGRVALLTCLVVRTTVGEEFRFVGNAIFLGSRIYDRLVEIIELGPAELASNEGPTRFRTARRGPLDIAAGVVVLVVLAALLWLAGDDILDMIRDVSGHPSDDDIQGAVTRALACTGGVDSPALCGQFDQFRVLDKRACDLLEDDDANDITARWQVRVSYAGTPLGRTLNATNETRIIVKRGSRWVDLAQLPGVSGGCP